MAQFLVETFILSNSTLMESMADDGPGIGELEISIIYGFKGSMAVNGPGSGELEEGYSIFVDLQKSISECNSCINRWTRHPSLTELTGILTPAAKSRDKLLQERQQELGQSAAKIAPAIQSLSRKEFSKGEVIKKLGESSRLICNIHFQYTDIRRKLPFLFHCCFISSCFCPFLDRNLTESLKENRRSENLYSNLEDSVKSFSAIKRAVNVIKPKNMANKTTGNQSNKREAKNYQQPRRQQYQYHSQGKRGAYHQHPQYHQQRQAYKPPGSRHQAGPSNRGRAKYP
ncbi:ORF1p [Operophtera brumata]|uniref:ORF1p n=1 Tax=Operophtera brumata TaxID=104452 RepID=A0A0L7KWA0_OPEBR|nr:ORF1p [Operophtera brumata]